tara:strand:- start:1418 stop:1906 length:489 start_codon:yes stop_codon:yes gene_type:complete
MNQFRVSLLLVVLLTNSYLIYSQELHHQMISSQGTSNTNVNGHVITHTIGQISITGNSDNIIQGFQQPHWNQLISTSFLYENIKVNHFPNPVINNLEFNFSNYDNGILKLLVFDFSGKVLIDKKITVSDGKSIINLNQLPAGTFLIYLNNDKVNYYTKIIKK